MEKRTRFLNQSNKFKNQINNYLNAERDYLDAGRAMPDQLEDLKSKATKERDDADK